MKKVSVIGNLEEENMLSCRAVNITSCKQKIFRKNTEDIFLN